MRFPPIWLFAFVLSSVFGYSQIKNIESMRMWTGNKKLEFDTAVNLSYTNNNGDYVFQFNAGGGALFKFRDKKGKLNNKLFFKADYSLIQSEDQDLNNNWFAHLRFNKEITNFFRIEAFIQSQVNRLLSINSRNLLGAGVRLKPLQKLQDKDEKDRDFHLYLGLAYMYEEEKSDDFSAEFYNHRASSYLTAAFRFGENGLEIINTLYYQPLFRDFSNYRISEELAINYPINKQLGFNTTFNFFENKGTPSGDPDFTSNVSFGLTYSFASKELKIDESLD